jgi:hypothetical protein
MKLRIHKNSLRLRLGPSEIARLLASGRIEETIRFAPGEDTQLTYALEIAPVANHELSVRCRPPEIAVLVPRAQAQQWADGDAVGVGSRIGVGDTTLELLVEKDFACIDRKAELNEDTFPNPKTGAIC